MNGLRQVSMHNTRNIRMNAFPAFKPDYDAETVQLRSVPTSDYGTGDDEDEK